MSAGAAFGATLIIVIGSDFTIYTALEKYMVDLCSTWVGLYRVLLYVSTMGFSQSYLHVVDWHCSDIATVGIAFLTFISSDLELGVYRSG